MRVFLPSRLAVAFPFPFPFRARHCLSCTEYRVQDTEYIQNTVLYVSCAHMPSPHLPCAFHHVPLGCCRCKRYLQLLSSFSHSLPFPSWPSLGSICPFVPFLFPLLRHVFTFPVRCEPGQCAMPSHPIPSHPSHPSLHPVHPSIIPNAHPAFPRPCPCPAMSTSAMSIHVQCPTAMPCKPALGCEALALPIRSCFARLFVFPHPATSTSIRIPPSPRPRPPLPSGAVDLAQPAGPGVLIRLFLGP